MNDITDKQMLKLYREVCRLQGETISKIVGDLKEWKSVCEKKDWTYSKIVQQIEHDCTACQTRCALRSSELKRLHEGLPHKAQETLKSLDLLD